MTDLIKPVRTYECWIDGWEMTEQQRSRYVRQKANQAKSAYAESVRAAGYLIRYIDVRCKSLRQLLEDPQLIRTAKYRNLPFVKTGMPCKLHGYLGRIVGAGAGHRFQIQLSQSGTIHYFHPHDDRVVWLNEDGSEFKPEKGAVA